MRAKKKVNNFITITEKGDFDTYFSSTIELLQ